MAINNKNIITIDNINEGYTKMDLNQEIDTWIENISTPMSETNIPESIPLPPQHGFEVEQLTESKDVKAENVPLLPADKKEIEYFDPDIGKNKHN